MARTQRDRLIDAMAQVVATKGYSGASLIDICSTAGVSTKAFYDQFADKEACFMSAFDRGSALLQKSVARANLEPGAWAERIHRGLGVLLSILAGEPAFAALAVVEVMAAGPRALQRRQRLLSSFAKFFAGAPEDPSIPAVPDVVVEAIIAGLYGVIFDHVADGRAGELPDRLPELTYFTLVPFIGAEAAATVADLHHERTG